MHVLTSAAAALAPDIDTLAFLVFSDFRIVPHACTSTTYLERPNPKLCCFLRHMQPEEFVTEVEKDNFQSVFHRAAAVHPECTLGLLVDKLETWFTQEERKHYRDNTRSDSSNAGGFR